MGASISSSWKRLSFGVGATAIGLTGVIGALHTPTGRPLLARFGVGCPVEASPAAVEQARRGAVEATRGTEPSPTRPALGFSLDTMTLSDVRTWARENQLSCDETRSGTLLRCRDVPTAAVLGRGAMIKEVAFGFTPQTNRLVNITTLRQELDTNVAAATMDEVAATLREQLGTPTISSGSRSAAYLGSGQMHTTMLAYRFSDYLVDISATNLGHGIVLREHYMSARLD